MVKERNTIKEELSNLANSIKETKKELKISQKDYSKIQYDTRPHYSGAEKWNIEHALYEEVYKRQSKLLSLKDEFRINHIVASIARGTSIRCIERNPKIDTHQSLIYMHAKQKLKELGIEWK